MCAHQVGPGCCWVDAEQACHQCVLDAMDQSQEDIVAEEAMEELPPPARQGREELDARSPPPARQGRESVQMLPAAMMQGPPLQAMGAVVVATEGAEGTCRQNGTHATIDYFLVSASLAPLVDRVAIQEAWPSAPHKHGLVVEDGHGGRLAASAKAACASTA